MGASVAYTTPCRQRLSSAETRGFMSRKVTIMGSSSVTDHGHSRSLIASAPALCLAFVLGCGGGGGSTAAPNGSAGQTGSAGATASGGASNASGASGVAGSGGTVAAGGIKGSSGGSAGEGAVSTGGSATTGGSGGAGGSNAGSSGSEGGRAGASGAAGISGNSGGGAGGASVMPSAGCGKTPTLKNSPTATANQNTLTINGASRQFLIRWPSNYDNNHPYRLILDFHGAGGKDTDLAPSYFGLFDLSANTTIFIAPSANGGIWDANNDSAFVDGILKAVQADLCIDNSRIELEGFSQGGAMVAVLACASPAVFRAAIGHSRGGLSSPTSCQPIPYLGSLGLSDISGNSQATQTDAFAKWAGCTVTTMPLAPTGGHVCTTYTGCPAGEPVTFCSFDGPHTPSPNDAGKSTSWMPSVAWPFLSQF